MPSPDTKLLPVLRGLFAHFSRRRRLQLALLFGLMFIGALAELLSLAAVIPFIALMAEPERAFDFPQLQTLFTSLGWERPEDIVFPMTILFLGLVLLATALRLSLTWASIRFSFGLGYDLSVSLYSRVLHQPYEYHVSQNTSDIIAGVTKVQSVIGGVVKPLILAMTGSVISLAIIGGLIAIEPYVAITAGLIFAFMYYLIVRIIRARLRANSTVIAAAKTERVRAIQEGLGGIRDVLLDGAQPHYARSFANVDGRLRKALASNAFIGGSPRYLVEAVGIVLIIGLAYFLAATPGGLVATLPVLGAMALGAQKLLPLFQQIYSAWSKVMGNRQVLQDVVDLLDLPRPDQDLTVGLNVVKFRESIELDKIWFKYQRSEEWVLKEFDLRISKGARVGLIGRTGSGKTTTMDIVMGLLEPTRGRILVDGLEVTSGKRRAWQNKIAHVPQFIYLTDASIAENIAFGIPKKRIDYERVRDAARRAQIADFIENSGRGYDATVGERGIQLSGGQRQRIGIARSLYKEAEVLVFDEATSALDLETEASLMSCIDELDDDLTIFMIAHRLQTLRFCDLIVDLEEGRIVQVGSYDEIIANAESNLRDKEPEGSATNA